MLKAIWVFSRRSLLGIETADRVLMICMLWHSASRDTAWTGLGQRVSVCRTQDTYRYEHGPTYLFIASF